MSLLLVMALSSFFLPHYLTFFLNNDTQNTYVLSYAKKLKIDAYFHYQRRNQPKGSSLWLQSTKALIKNNHIYTIELADYYKKQKKVNKAIFWYQQAIKHHLNGARLKLSSLYFKQNDYHAAKLVLQPLLDNLERLNSEEVLSLLLNIALIEGDLQRARRLVLDLEKLNPTHNLLAEIIKFKVFSSAKPEQLKSSYKRDKNCVASMQFFATNLADLRYSENLIEQVKSYPLSTYSCFNSVRYIPLEKLKCSHENNEAITCNESIWKEYQDEIDSRFIGVLVPKGGAKVHNGIMYLDRNDSVDVFSHELAHLFGFVDEYSLPENHIRCSRVQESSFSYNITVLPKNYVGVKLKIRQEILQQLAWRDAIKEDTPILTRKENKWELGTPKAYKDEVGLFLSDTCKSASLSNALNIQAFKPLAKRTSLNYFELEFPLLYQRLLISNPERFLMPSFHTNIEKSLDFNQ